MDFNEDGEYAVSKHQLVHKRVSLAIVIGYAIFAGFEYGAGQSFRLSAGFVLPLVLIWKCDELAGWLSISDAPTRVRLAGWAILVILISLRIYAHLIV